jgi:hypothetical protein
MTFSFRNRIRLQTGKRLAVEAESYELLGDGAERVVLQSGLRDQLIKDVGELALIGSGYPDFAAALQAGVRWRQIVSAVLARLATGAEFGDHLSENLVPRRCPVQLLQILNFDESALAYFDRIGLLIFDTEPAAEFIFASGDAIGSEAFPQNAPALISGAQGRDSGEWNDELKLAYQLIHASLSDNRNPEARFILAVTAIEALIPYRYRFPEVVDVLDALKAHVDARADLDDETRDLVLRLLDGDKSESVRGFGLKLTDRLTRNYDGKPPRKYFDYVYGTRSDLAHGNLRDAPRLGIDALNQQYVELLAFVLDILEAWTPDYSVCPDRTGESQTG